MPIANIQDTTGVEQKLQEILSNGDVDRRLQAIRELFVGILDYDNADQLVSLESAGNAQLPKDAHVAARRDGVTVAYIPLDDAPTNRVNGIVVSAAAKALGNVLADDLLLIFTNRERDQLHIISPDLSGIRPKLQRLVAYRDQLQRTVPQQIANMWDNYGNKSKTLRESIKEAFNVEPVTQDFFGTYSNLFEEAKEKIRGFRPEEADQKQMFTQTLFNRLMFVYFLSRKGWLKFEGNPDYLKALWSSYSPESSAGNFYNTHLRPLFFNGLNNPDVGILSEDEKSLIGDVPFLNGGLFEETNLDNRKDIEIPDTIIEHMLDRLFERFNFTVMESTPYDVEVAVDPEMLGKVFEELVTGRHESGAYYTPRPVVSFMCREAIKAYLEAKDASLDAGAIAQFVDEHDTSALNVAAARRLSSALAEVTVVDPACGSGAYLLGMMQELVELQTTLYDVGVDSKTLYDLKLEIIERNLYGADIDEFAVNITMLRLWLSLAIDYEDDHPEPLPNLDFKILCGDSLLAPNPGTDTGIQGILGRSTDQVQQLDKLDAEYVRTSREPRRGQLRQEIHKLKENIRKSIGEAGATDKVVDWRVEFPGIFGARQGFDIAIANPPYVRQEQIGNNKALLQLQYGDAATLRSDLYCYFYARGLQLLAHGGVHVFVCSNSWLDVEYGARLQEFLLRNSHLRAIYESAVERQFSTADINTVITVLTRTQVNEETAFISLRAEFETAVADSSLQREIRQTKNSLWAAGTNNGKYIGGTWGAKFLRAPDIYHHILQTYADRLVALDELSTIRRGITTGVNNFFLLSEEDLTRWGIEEEFLKPIMTSPQESRSVSIHPDNLPCRLFLCNRSKQSLRGTKALDYIQHGEQLGYHRRKTTSARRRWYDLGTPVPTPILMNKMIDITSHTFLATGEVYANNVLYEIHCPATRNAKICSALNSTLAQLSINTEGRVNFGGGMLELAAYEVKALRVVHPDLMDDVDRGILDNTDWDSLNPSKARFALDSVVFGALGLTQGEQDEIYEGVVGLVTNRKLRAQRR